ncbi:MAG: hypothetical protein ACRD3E_13390 [Terriglobales bacterium]
MSNNGDGERKTNEVENARILNGWKEIATFVGRGVRTVQRWETLGLPVRRPNGHLRSAVVATADELSSWLTSTPRRELEMIAELQARVTQLEMENSALRMELEDLRSGSRKTAVLTRPRRRAEAAS